MKMARFLVATLSLLLANHVAAAGVKVGVSPVTKVIEMLNELIKKAGDEKHEEAVRFSAFKQFCDDVTLEKQTAIQDADEKIEQLKANIQKFDAEVDRLAKEIEELEVEIPGFQNETAAAHQERADERTNYTAAHKDYSESIDAIIRAIAVLKQQAHDRPAVSALMQDANTMRHLPLAARRVLNAFLSTEEYEPELAISAPEANAYEFQSSDIIDMMEKLRIKFEDERTALEKQELENRHAYGMLVQSLQASIRAAESTMKKNKKGVASNKQASADASSQLTTISDIRNSDDEYLTNLANSCRQKSDDFENRQKLRADELEALRKAVEIISSDAVSGAAEKHLPSFMQKYHRSVLTQLRSSRSNPESQQRVASYLKSQADQIGSRALSVVAMRVQEGPFDKVKQLIEQLISRLMAQAAEEADHKGWCDDELATNEQTRNDKASEVESLHSQIDGLTARIEVLKKDIAKLSEEVAEINKAVAKATELRSKEREDNNNAIADAVEAQTAVAKAITVLKDFYATAGESTALVQAHKVRQAPPPTFDSSYKGQQGGSKGILAMLDVIQSDFARLEKETTEEENWSQSDYENFMEDSSADKAQHEKDLQEYSAEQQRKESDLQEAQTSLEAAQAQLDAALTYYEKLKPSCLDAGVSYDDRVTRRQQEIQSLKEALRILSGEDFATVEHGVLVDHDSEALK